jgi:Phosphorylase superfamily
MNSGVAALPFDAILVPQGQEYQAVCRGLKVINVSKPMVIAIPLGMKAVEEFFRVRSIAVLCQKKQPKLLLMGLAGGLSSQHRVGDIVIYQDCIRPLSRSNYQSQQCDRDLTALLQQNLGKKVRLVRGLTSSHLIHTAQEKQELDRLYPASVVDMEGFSLLSSLSSTGASIAMIRVIGDDFSQDIPDLTMSFRENGSINPFLLAIALGKQPFAAQRLIANSLQALSILEQFTKESFSISH